MQLVIAILEYKEILSNYDMKQIIIKPHPADPVQYEKVFPECYTLSKVFPVQMLEWLDITPNKVILFKGSSCERLFIGKCEVDIY